MWTRVSGCWTRPSERSARNSSSDENIFDVRGRASDSGRVFCSSEEHPLSDHLTPIRYSCFWTLLITFFICAAFALDAPTSPGADNGSIHWQAVTEAQVKVDDKIPLTWNIYQPDKKNKKQSNLVLMLLGHRYVLVDTKAKLVYEVPLSEIHMQGKDVDTDGLPGSAPMIPSSDWTFRDVGPAELIQVKLGDYGRTITFALPHQLDIRLGIY
jgi:hypothetical protein